MMMIVKDLGISIKDCSCCGSPVLPGRVFTLLFPDWKNSYAYILTLVKSQKFTGGCRITAERGLGLDEIDCTILHLLKENSRMSFQEMSKRTGISDATIQFRVKRMRSWGVIDKFTIHANPSATGYEVTALILVQTDTDKHHHAKAALARIPEATEVYSILGEYDLLIKVWSRSIAELNALMNRIRSVDGIEDLLEMVVAERVKEEMPPV